MIYQMFSTQFRTINKKSLKSIMTIRIRIRIIHFSIRTFRKINEYYLKNDQIYRRLKIVLNNIKTLTKQSIS